MDYFAVYLLIIKMMTPSCFLLWTIWSFLIWSKDEKEWLARFKENKAGLFKVVGQILADALFGLFLLLFFTFIISLIMMGAVLLVNYSMFSAILFVGVFLGALGKSFLVYRKLKKERKETETTAAE